MSRPAFDASRLQRTDWGESQILVDELYAMISSWNLEGLQGPLKIRTDDTSPAMIFEMPPAMESQPIQIISGGTQWNIPAIPGSFNPLVTPDPLQPQIPGLPPYQPSSPPPASPTSPGTTSPPSLPDREESDDTLDEPPQANPPALPYPAIGRVHSGSGHAYVVDLWLADPEDGTAPPWGRFPARVIEIDDGETVPAGTIVTCTCYTVIRSGVRAVVVYFQPPIILGE